MSGDEKAEQIGRVVSQYQDAKVELAHLDKKLKTVSQVYKQVGEALERPYYQIKNGRFVDSYSKSENIGTHLLNEQDLTALIAERDAARKKLDDLRSEMKALGITSVE